MPLDASKYPALDAAVAMADPAASSADLAMQPGWFAPIPSYAPISLATLEEYLLTNSLQTPLKRIAADAGVNAQITAGLTDFLDLLDSPRLVNLGYDDPVIRGRTQLVLGAVVSLGRELTADHAAAIEAMGTKGVYQFGGSVTAADVVESRARLAAAAAQAARDALQASLLAAVDARLTQLVTAAAYGAKPLRDYREGVAGGDLTLPVPSDADVIAAYTANVPVAAQGGQS